MKNIYNLTGADIVLQRMYQGIDKIPNTEIQESSGVIGKEQILGGLCHHYYRSSA